MIPSTADYVPLLSVGETPLNIQPDGNRVEVPRPNSQTRWINEELGIRHKREFKRYDTRCGLEKAFDFTSLIAGEVGYAFGAIPTRIAVAYNNISYPHFDDESALGKTGSQGLAVLFHGVNGHPSAWNKHVEALEQQGNNLDIMPMELPNKGHCYTNGTEAQALLNRVVDWTRRNPGKPIALFAHSNGSRFAVRLETWLRERAPQTPVHVSLAGGVLYGSSRINQLMSLASPDDLQTLTRGFISPILCEELAFGSDSAKNLLREARTPLAENVANRDYVMYATLNDTHVPDCGSSLAIVNPDGAQSRKTERHYLVHTYGHLAMANSLAKEQVADCLNWMHRHGSEATIH